MATKLQRPLCRKVPPPSRPVSRLDTEVHRHYGSLDGTAHCISARYGLCAMHLIQDYLQVPFGRTKDSHYKPVSPRAYLHCIKRQTKQGGTPDGISPRLRHSTKLKVFLYVLLLPRNGSRGLAVFSRRKLSGDFSEQQGLNETVAAHVSSIASR